ncbi:MAG TPA: menaquinone biosynthesis protein [Nitriliruptorales bacterium]
MAADLQLVRRPRVGHIQFLNCLPLYHGLVHSQAVLDLELTKGTPTELNAALLEGRLDAGPISSVEYLRHASELLLLPDLVVAADGAVRSITLASRRPVEELDGAMVALTNTSATSVALLELLLRERWNVKVESFSCPPDLPRMLEEADAALLIGDDAMRANYADLHTYDLSEQWQAHTGWPMVFAVWAVRRDWAAEHADQVAAVHAAFQRSLEHSLAELAAIAADAARWEPFSAADLEAYFRGLEFRFGPREQSGLVLFAERLASAGGYGLERVPAFDFAPVWLG